MQIKDFKPRLYQETILHSCVKHNCLIILPTGLGKTKTAILVAVHRLNTFPNSKVLFLTPTKPLANQICQEFKECTSVDSSEIFLFTGEISPEKREQQWSNAKIVVSTPQGCVNDIINGRIAIEDISLMVFDEAHRAVGDYDYVFLAKQYHKRGKFPRIIGLTASPGSDLEKITEVSKNLFIENIELRTEHDPDVKPYIQELDVDYVLVDLPDEFKETKKFLDDCFKSKLQKVKDLGLVASVNYVTKKDILGVQKDLQKRVLGGEKDFTLWHALSLVAEAIKVHHALELFETQGISATCKYMKGLYASADKTKVKAVKSLVKDLNFKSAYVKILSLYERGVEHPKLGELKKVVQEELNKNAKSKMIVFNQYRDSASKLVEELNKIDNVRCSLFVGQMKKGETGMSQKEQIKVLDKFKEKEINTLVATSVDPNEYIILKSPEEVIEIKKIGEFVNPFINTYKKDLASKKIKGWRVLSTNDKKVDFYPITEVHKHKRQNSVVNVVLDSGFRCLVTENHSLFTFNCEGKTIPTPPEKNKFVSIASSVPNIERATKVDVVKELLANIPKGGLDKVFCYFKDITQAKIRIYSTELKVLSKLNKKRFKTELSRLGKLDLSTITDSTKRLEKAGFIKSIRHGRRIFCEITELGEEYLGFLKWFFKYQYYHKGKYRCSLKNMGYAPKTVHKFCDICVGVWYGKSVTPPFLELNEYLAEFLGWYVSEGSTKHTKHSSDVFLAARNKEIQQRMAMCVSKGLYLKPSVTWRGVALNSQIAHYLIKYVFKCGIGAYNKEVPSIIFSAPTKQKLRFLESYFLGDGNVSKKGIVFTTVSRKLATGLIFLLRQLGIKKITLGRDNCYRINVYESLPFVNIKNKKGNKKYYDVSPSALFSKKSFEKYNNSYVNMQKKSGRCRVIKKPEGAICFDYTKKIEKADKQPKFVYDLSVKDTERFCGGPGLICLHNSIGEEGLDIPKVDVVIFYEPIPSAIRTIQRCGRTARTEKGRVVVLVTKNTRDEAYRWTAYHKEKRMHQILTKLRDDIQRVVEVRQQPTLNSFANETKLKVFADFREKGSGIIKELVNQGLDVNMQSLAVGDYILSNRVGVEFKTKQDFVNSLIDKRLLQQVKALKESFEKPLLIVEGEEDIYSVRKVHPNAINGMIASIVIDFGVPIVYTKNFLETSSLLKAIANREQEFEKKDIGIRTERKPLTTKEQQEFVIESFPNVGPNLAKALLKEFKSVKNVINAGHDDLQKVENLGPKKSEEIKRIVDEIYDESA